MRVEKFFAETLDGRLQHTLDGRRDRSGGS